MDIMEKFYESLYDRLSDEEFFYYSDGPTLPPLQLNQVYSLTRQPVKMPRNGITGHTWNMMHS
eukprot:11387612-Prorocentrum_lima.AAC.1